MMDASSEADQENSLKFIRKLRKKLRQIERLQKGQRELTDEEKIKLSCKQDIREKLQLLLSTISEANISFESTKSDAADEAVKEVEVEDDGGGEGKAFHDDAAPCSDSRQERDMTDYRVQKSEAISESVIRPSAPLLEDIILKKDNKAGKGKKGASQPLRSVLRRQWRNSTFIVNELQGHNDAVSAVAADECWAVSGSRDTTLKLWQLESGKELRNMGGHGGQVTSVVMLSKEDSDALRQGLDRSTIQTFTDIEEKESEKEKFVISGSTDCTIRLWLLPQGLSIKSLYNYNPVSTLEYVPEKKCIFVGSSSGNLTVYNLCTNAQFYSSTVHSSQITKLLCVGQRLFSSSADGCIKVWRIQSGQTKRRKAENLRFSNLEFEVTSDEFNIEAEHSFEGHERYMAERQIHTFLTHKNRIYFGDDGANIKIWNSESGELAKMRNHKPGIPGITDNLCCFTDILLSSSYDLDTGCGSLNVRSLHSECYGVYLASFCHEGMPRLPCLACVPSGDSMCLVTGGEKLLVWKLRKPGISVPVEDSKVAFAIKGQNIQEMTKPSTDSDAASEGDTTDDDDEGKWFWQRKRAKPEKSRSAGEEEASDSDESGSEAGPKWDESSSLNKSSFSVCDWCNLI